MNTTNSQFDIVIVGGGFVGTSLAIALSKYFKIVLIDKNKFKSIMPLANSLDQRGIALTKGSINFLNTCGVLKAIDKEALIKKVHISKEKVFGVTKVDCKTYEQDFLGAVFDFDALQVEINIRAIEVSKSTNLEIIDEASIGKIEQYNNLWQLSYIKDNQEYILTSKLLVGADGTNSYIRDYLKFETTDINYDEKAIITNLELESNHNNLAFERFTDIGTLALLPFGNKNYKCVWTVSSVTSKMLFENNADEIDEDNDFINLVYKKIGSRIGKIKKVGKRVVFPLNQKKSNKIISKNAVIIGNAANTMHPIAAQGLNLGLRDCATLVEILYFAKLKNRDIQDYELLESYLKLRKDDHDQINTLTHNLTKIPKLKSIISNLAVSIGLIASNNRLINKLIYQKGEGLIKNTPLLMKGIRLEEYEH